MDSFDSSSTTLDTHNQDNFHSFFNKNEGQKILNEKRYVKYIIYVLVSTDRSLIGAISSLVNAKVSAVDLV